MFNKYKYKITITGRYDPNLDAIVDNTVKGIGDEDALMNAMVMGCVSFAYDNGISQNEVISAIKQTFKEFRKEGEK